MKCNEKLSSFDRAGLWIVRMFPGILCGKQGRSIEKKLKLLETTKEKRSPEVYYAKKFAAMLKVFLAGGILLGILGVTYAGKVSWLQEAVIERPKAGEGEKRLELQASVQNSEPLAVSVVIGERAYSDAEIKEVFARILTELETKILGENTSLKEIRSDLSLPDTFQNGTVKAIWDVEPYEYMDMNGELRKEVPKEGVEGILRLRLEYREETLLQEYPITLLPKIKTPEEEQADKLKAMIEQKAEEDPQEPEVILPKDLEGQKVTWGKENQNLLLPGSFLLLMGLLFCYERGDQKLEEEEKRRNKQMIMDYPIILYRMSMLLDAGMTIRSAFTKIALFYKERNEKEVHYAYEAMLFACEELETGVGEAAVYEKFGRRCQELRFLKFGSLLSQNLKKGSEGLAGLLEQEARDGMEERKNLARKLGEEASMKLLFPMLLMLILVMVILMVPAMLSF